MQTRTISLPWLPNWRGDLTGGAVSATVAIPLAMAYGMFAFVPLGDEYFAYGAIAGLYAAIVVAVVSVALGQRDPTLYAPRVTTTFILGGLLYQLVHSDLPAIKSGNLQLAVLAFYAIVFLAGWLQALFGLIRLGTLLRFTPQPVMAGFQNAAAALLFLVQLGNVCGLDRNVSFMRIGSHLHEVKPLSLAVAAVTFAAMWTARSFVPRVPPLVVGLAAGSAIYFLLVAVGFGSLLGPEIGPSSAAPALQADLLTTLSSSDLAGLAPTVLGGALAVAVVSALDALLCAKLAASASEPKADGNRMLIRLGIGNIFSAGAGGITGGLNIGASLANRAFGARTALSVVFNAAVLAVIGVLAFPLLSHLPRAVLSAAIMVVAVQHFDKWSLGLLRRLSTDGAHHRLLTLLDLGVILLVMVLAVTIHIVLAVFLGIVIAIAMFVVRMSRSNIRRKYRCHTIHSRRARAPREAAFLEQNGRRILVLELQGPLFFGTAEMLNTEIDALRAGTRSVIIDMRRVTEVDATGAQTLNEIAATLARDDQRLGLALTRRGEATVRIFESGVIDLIGADALFDDVDRAIEWAEDDLLSGTDAAADHDITLREVQLLQALDDSELDTVAKLMPRVSYEVDREIFRKGTPGDELYIVANGRASAYLEHHDGVRIRLATFSRGTVFGELAILDAGPRLATVVADERIDCWVLQTQAFVELSRTAPGIAIKLLTGVGRELSVRLRQANKTIDQLEK
jgi:MFS superfamily sulfate permease-like transporter